MPRATLEKDYYAILGVDPKATLDTIKARYRTRAREVHPDKSPDDPNATAMFQNVGFLFFDIYSSRLGFSLT
jgi:curved DNA-binding protein CbpA